jgi:hypothetical protein
MIHNCFFGFERVLDRGPEQRESNTNALYLQIIIILISYIIIQLLIMENQIGLSNQTLKHRYRKAKIDCLSFVYVPATSATHNRLLFFFFLLRPFTVLMKKTRAIKQSIFLRCLCVEVIFNGLR